VHVRPTIRKLAKVRAKEVERSLSSYVEWLIEADVSNRVRSEKNLNDAAEIISFAETFIAANDNLFKRLAK
jgi:hypothetical protein